MNADVFNAFRLVAPEFADIPDGDVGKWVELCSPLVSSKKFGKLYAQALAFLTAHRMKISGVGHNVEEDPLKDVNKISAGGLMRVGSFSEGETSISFNSGVSQYASSDAELALTQYGVQYMSIRRLMVIPLVSAGERNGRA